jgi:hypothetical protein
MVMTVVTTVIVNLWELVVAIVATVGILETKPRPGPRHLELTVATVATVATAGKDEYGSSMIQKEYTKPQLIEMLKRERVIMSLKGNRQQIRDMAQ